MSLRVFEESPCTTVHTITISGAGYASALPTQRQKRGIAPGSRRGAAMQRATTAGLDQSQQESGAAVLELRGFTRAMSVVITGVGSDVCDCMYVVQ